MLYGTYYLPTALELVAILYGFKVVVACDKSIVVKTVCSYVHFSFMCLSHLEDLFSTLKDNI